MLITGYQIDEEKNEKKMVADAKPLLTEKAVINGMKDSQLPGSLRATFCDLLYLWLEMDLPPKTSANIKYTWSYHELDKDIAESNEVMSSSSLSEFKNVDKWKELREFLLNFIKDYEQIQIYNREANTLLLSIVELIYKLVRHGFFPFEDQEALLIPLMNLLDLAKDVGKEQNKFERDGYSILVMVSNICSIGIF